MAIQSDYYTTTDTSVCSKITFWQGPSLFQVVQSPSEHHCCIKLLSAIYLWPAFSLNALAILLWLLLQQSRTAVDWMFFKASFFVNSRSTKIPGGACGHRVSEMLEAYRAPVNTPHSLTVDHILPILTFSRAVNELPKPVCMLYTCALFIRTWLTEGASC